MNLNIGNVYEGFELLEKHYIKRNRLQKLIFSHKENSSKVNKNFKC